MPKFSKGDRVQVNIANMNKWNVNLGSVVNDKLGIIDEIHEYITTPILGDVEHVKVFPSYIEFLVKFDSPAVPVKGHYLHKEFNSFWFREFDLKLL